MTEAFAVLGNQMAKVSQVVDNMDSSTSIESCWLQEPKIITTEMAERHGQLKDVLLKQFLAIAYFIIY